MSGGYAAASQAKSRRIPRITISNRLGRGRPPQSTELRKMKMSIKQRIRNWLMNDDDTPDPYSIEDENGPDLNSHSFRLNIYGASGGTIIETTKYDRKSDENRHSLHIVTEDKDLGEELAKIITMEQLR
jgi:broad specificity polyphosphatase/5'/3'-nucleotidase SurE